MESSIELRLDVLPILQVFVGILVPDFLVFCGIFEVIPSLPGKPRGES